MLFLNISHCVCVSECHNALRTSVSASTPRSRGNGISHCRGRRDLSAEGVQGVCGGSILLPIQLGGLGKRRKIPCGVRSGAALGRETMHLKHHRMFLVAPLDIN